MKNLFFLFLSHFLLSSMTWSVSPAPNQAQSVLDSILQQTQYDPFLRQGKDYNIQIIYTQIDRSSKGIEYRNAMYGKNEYFYPASTVKLPLAIMTLEKLDSLKKNGIPTDLNTPFRTSSVPCSPSWPKKELPKTNFNNEIKRMLVISDNNAYNRTFEFLGPTHIQNKLHLWGLNQNRISHRFVFCSDVQNAYTNAFYFGQDSITYTQPETKHLPFFPPAHKILIGQKWMDGSGKIHNEPYDFTLKNSFDLLDLHKILQQLIYPQNQTLKSNYKLTPESRRFILKYLASWPAESQIKGDDSTDYDNNYTQYLFYGNQKGKTQVPGLRIFNIVGQSYGFLSDIAYFYHPESKTEFFLSAVIFANAAGIINSGNYDYKVIGFPFLATLGQDLFTYEKNRKNKTLFNSENLNLLFEKAAP